MGIQKLLQWQWDGYTRYHRSRGNLFLHIVLVPMFWIGSVGLVVSATRGLPYIALLNALSMVISIGLQGHGHQFEQTPPEPFTSVFNSAARIFLEQWVTFPRFVLSGGWWKAVNASPKIK